MADPSPMMYSAMETVIHLVEDHQVMPTLADAVVRRRRYEVIHRFLHHAGVEPPHDHPYYTHTRKAPQEVKPSVQGTAATGGA